MRRIGRLTAPFFVALAGMVSVGAAQEPVVYRIDVTGTIENGLAPYVARGLREAQEAGAAAAYVHLDTPGGRVDAAERITDAVRAADIPVYAYVNPRAFSAGAMVALASDGIYMRPGAVIGAATPVDGQGTKAPEKIVSAMRGEFRALAEEQGIDPRLAEAMVDESIEIPGVVAKGQLLTLSTNEAVELEVADGVAADEAALLSAIGLPGATVVAVETNWAEDVVRFLTNPVVAPLLLSLGMLGLMFELKTGGFGLGGVVGVASLGLFFGSSYILGLAGWEEVLLLGLGVIALAAEILILPGFGIAGLLGIAAIGGAVVLSMLGAFPTSGDVMEALAILGASLLIVAAVSYAWLRHLPGSNRFSGLLLHGAGDRADGFVSAPERGDLVGVDGVALTDLRPSGTARFGDERVDVVTEGEYLAQGTVVRVVRSEGYRHVVRAAG